MSELVSVYVNLILLENNKHEEEEEEEEEESSKTVQLTPKVLGTPAVRQGER